MKRSKNYNMYLPEKTEFYDVEDMNRNTEIIDEELKKIENAKVDKESGKGLSKNNYTDAEKEKLEGIAEGAEVNVQPDWNVTDKESDAYIKNKPTSMPASDVPAWAKNASKPSYAKDEIGLGSVPNVSTNDQTPTFTQASTRTNIASGEKLSTIFGKIMKWFADLKTVAFSGSYTDLSNKPAIPSKLSELTNDSGYKTTDTTYGVVSKTANGLAPKLPNETMTTKYLRQDGTWAVPPDTDTKYTLPLMTASVRGGAEIGYTANGKNYPVQLNNEQMYVNVPWTDTNTVYTHPNTSGNKHIPSGGSSGQILRWSADGTAIWGSENKTISLIDLFPGSSDSEGVKQVQLGGTNGNTAATVMYTATEECLVTLNGYVAYIGVPSNTVIVVNTYIEGKIINANSALGSSGSNVNMLLSSTIRLKKGEALKLQIGSPQTLDMVTANIHYILKVLPIAGEVKAPI